MRRRRTSQSTQANFKKHLRLTSKIDTGELQKKMRRRQTSKKRSRRISKNSAAGARPPQGKKLQTHKPDSVSKLSFISPDHY
jgi:hypothetical protein